MIKSIYFPNPWKAFFFSICMLFNFGLMGISNPGKAQSPYELSWQKDVPIGGLGIGSFVIGNLWEARTPIFTNLEILQLDANSVNRLDRSTTNRWSPAAAKWSDGFLLGTGATPLLWLADKKIRKDWFTLGVIGLETVVLNEGVTSLFKGGFRRARPFVYNPVAPMDRKVEKNARYSFISGHASFSSSLSFLAARVYLDYHPDSKLKPLIWGLATVLPATTAYLRVHAGKHFPTDVVAGYVSGVLIGYFVPVLHRKRNQGIESSNGLGLAEGKLGRSDRILRGLQLLPQIGSSNGLQLVYRF